MLSNEMILSTAKEVEEYVKLTRGYLHENPEISGQEFTDKIEHLLKEIHRRTNGEVAVTLSLGEQTREIYEKWRAAGASRYLLRIETSNPEIYNKIHPTNTHHSFEETRKKQAEKRFDYWVQEYILQKAKSDKLTESFYEEHKKNASELKSNPSTEAKIFVEKLIG